MFIIPAIEEFERDFEPEESEFSSADRWPAPYDYTHRPPKKTEAESILKWKSPTQYKDRSVIYCDVGTGKSGWIKSSPSVLNEEKLLAFKGDPDDKDFVPISKETVKRAGQFLAPYLFVFSTDAGNVEVSPGPDGSVDIHWKNAKKELLINIPADKDEPAFFYGDNYGKISIKGRMETNSLHPSVLMWLINS